MFFKIKRLVIFLLCFLKFFVSGKANKKIKNPKKIIVAQTAKLGDMVCTTPMFRAIKEKYPAAKVFVIGNSVNKELLIDNPDVDGYFIYKNNFWELVKAVKKEKIDFACDTNPNLFMLAVLYLAGVSLIAAPVIENGYSPVETRLYKILRKLVVAVPHRMGSYAPRQYLRLLEPVGVFSDRTEKHLYFSSQAELKVKKFFDENNISIEREFLVGISPSVGNKIKEWDAGKFAQLADYIYSKYHCVIVITGGSGDAEKSKEMIKALSPETKFIDATGLFDMDGFKAMMSKLFLFISVDTGPIYIAEAYGVPTIDIVGPMDDNEQPPRGERNRIVKLEDRKQPAIHIMNSSDYDYKEARRQIDEITADMVIEKVEELAPVIGLKKRDGAK
ncbi:MAG: glycosyltransferase family 9 protein [Candidatus Pacebacteria bacterium]|nr:glycosyltransferase family 9 protein [Candidatus Paceibacterota bacterium]NUQ57073.1 glycosyltransferase family 9 protein [Candidatus Paceibacter sp.]